MTVHEKIRQFLFRTSKAMLGVDREVVGAAVKALAEAREQDGFVWLVGNGGSAALASHFANDLVKLCGIRAISIPDLVPTMTAYGNDDGWHKMFSHTLENYASKGHVLVAFSCGGYSGNVIEAARGWSGPVIIFTGDRRDSKLVMESQGVVIFVDDADIMAQESVHAALCHAIVDVLKEK